MPDTCQGQDSKQTVSVFHTAMATAQHSPAEPPLSTKRSQNLQEMLTEVGLSVDYWLPILKEHLGVTCAQALQHLEENDLQKLKSHTQHPWEKKALEKLLTLSHSLSDLQESQDRVTQKKQKQAEQALQELKELQSERGQQMEEAMRKNPDLKRPLEITEEYRLPPQKPLREVMGEVQRSPPLIEGTMCQRQNLPDKELLTWASGGLALQGIYKTHHQSELIERREKLLSVPKDFSLSGPEQHTRTETKEFTSSQAQSMFTQNMEKLGFSLTASIKGGGWGFSLEAGTDYNKHSESKESKRSCSEHSYFCSMKFQYIPIVSFHFSIDQLQFSKAALQELKRMEDLLDPNAGPHRFSSLMRRTEKFFHRFGSHANQGPLHLGGIYWWKAVSEGFQQEQLAEVRQQSAQALDSYIRGGYSGFGVKVAGGMNVSDSHSQTDTEMKMFQNLQINMQLSVAHTGGPPEADDLVQWKAGLVASNQTWCVIDRGLQLVPIWDIILSSHRTDFKNPVTLANFLKESYVDLINLKADIQDGEEFLSTREETKLFLEDVKHWEISDPEEQLRKLINFMQMLSQKVKSYDIWINICLTDWNLQNYLVNTVDFYKKSSGYNTKFIKSQLRSLLDPHIYSVTNFPEAHAIMQWICQSESEQEQIKISQISELIKILKETQNELMEMKVRSESPENVEESEQKATCDVSLALSSFLNYLQETDQPDTQLLLLCIAAGAGYHVVNKTFQHRLGCDELNFLLREIQTTHDKYQELKKFSSARAQAFLVLTGLTATAGVRAISSEKKMQRLSLMRQHMGPSLCKEVAQVLSKYGAHDWESLENGLRLLIDGDYEATVSSLQMDEMRMQLQRLLDCKKQPHELKGNESNKKEVIENEAFRSLFQHLGLENYYPRRMSRADFHLIYKTSVYNTHPSSEKELPFYFLEKLLMLDYGLRYLVLKDNGNTEHQIYSTATNQEKEDWDPYQDFFADSDSPAKCLTTETRPHIHPMDIQMAIFHCADDFARQYILTKLSICQFALPLVVPNPCTSHIEFSLWPFRQIRKSWQQEKKTAKGRTSYKNQQMCQVSAPIVSFVRVGNGFSASKSQIMNWLLIKRKHDVFFHRHCIGSSKDCLLMGGVIEICWFCPGGEDEDRFNKCVTFTNLHGDAKEHQQQLTFLQEVSSLIVVLMSASDESEENRKIVRDLFQSPRPLICLLDDKEKSMASNSGQRVKIGIRNRNEAELTQELTTTIRRLLELSDTALSLEDCAQIAHKHGFLIDENQNDCKEAKEKAQTLMALLKETELSQVKENLLPLQGQLWHLWCKKDKELYHLREKGNRSIEQHKSEIETAKQMIRHEQLTKAFPPNDLIRSVLQILLLYSETNTKLYFIQWLSMFMDNLTQIVTKLVDVVKKKNKGGVAVKAHQVKNHMWIFVNALIENPTFDSQTKENMTLQAKSFGSTCQLSEKFIKAAIGCGIVESILNWVKFKAQVQLNKKCSAVKHNRIKGIPKLDDANDAGGRNSAECTLILTEGDSAKTLAVSGLGVVGRDKYGVFPLRGKILNVREASHKQIMENAEINNIIKIVGLQYKKNYEDEDSLKTLRYGKIMIMTDQDQDGSHIKGLLINFIHHNWPSLLRHRFLEEFITPIVKVSKNKQEIAFYSLPEFEEWKSSTPNHKKWKVKYYKGLGTSTSKEAKEYFADMKRHRIQFKYSGPEDDAAISLAFSKKQIDDRKEWLTHFMEDRRQRKLLGLPEDYLYGQTTTYLTYNDFINKELILFSNSDNERSIPSMVDGLKPGQRKVLFTCFKRNDKREVKVAQLAGSVAEMSSYHHGEMSLMMTIINLAQNFVGSNNLNLLQPIGQFGTRLHGGKDSASPRYIFTMLSPLARLLFPPKDDHTLKFLYDDNQRVEPEWYIPIIPMVLVNGAEGIGTGWSCKIPNFDVREVVNNIRRLMDGEELLPMLPSYKNFKGTIEELAPNQYVISGEVAILNSTTIEISELPIRTWTQTYKEQVLEPMLNGTEKTPPLITDYKEYHTDTTVKFVVKMTEEKLAEAERVGLHKVFKLQTSLTCNSMVLFDHVGCLKKYDTVLDILRDFFELRLKYYGLRKEWLLGMLGAESAKLNNQARFILEKIDGKIIIENKPKKELIKVLIQRGYDSDPVKAWKEAQQKVPDEEENEESDNEKETEKTDSVTDSGPTFNYLLDMPLWYLTKEKKDELCKLRNEKEQELDTLKRKSPSDLWKEDLAAFIEELEAVEAKEKQDEQIGLPGKGGKGKGKKTQVAEVLPSPRGKRVIPRVTIEMKAEAEKKIKKKIKSENTEGSPQEDGVELEGLKQRIEKKQRREPGTKTKKQSTLPFKPIKKGKKKNPWSDSESDMSSNESNFDVPPRETEPRRAAAKTKFTMDLDSDDDFSDFDENSEDEDFVPSDASPPKTKTSQKHTNKESKPLKSTMSIVDLEVDDAKNSVPVSSSLPATDSPAETEIINPASKKNVTVKKTAAKSQSSTSTTGAQKRAAPKGTKRDPTLKSDASQKPEPAKTKNRRKRKPSTSDDSDSNFEKIVSKAITSKKSKRENDDFHVDSAVSPRAKSGRSKKPIKYLEESDEDDLF